MGHESLGPLTFGKKEEQIFLGREIAQHRDYSEDTAIKIDQEVRRIADDGYKAAVDVLSGHRETLEKVAQMLLEREVLDANEIQMIIEGKELPIKVAPPVADEVQKVLKPEPGRQPSASPGPGARLSSCQLPVISSQLGDPKDGSPVLLVVILKRSRRRSRSAVEGPL